MGNKSICVGSEYAEVMGHFLQEGQVGVVDPATDVLLGETALIYLVVEFEGKKGPEVIPYSHLGLYGEQVVFMSQPLVVVQQNNYLAQRALLHRTPLQV
jgi:hypothetical protein